MTKPHWEEEFDKKVSNQDWFWDGDWMLTAEGEVNEVKDFIRSLVDKTRKEAQLQDINVVNLPKELEANKEYLVVEKEAYENRFKAGLERALELSPKKIGKAIYSDYDLGHNIALLDWLENIKEELER